jgi:hypothetical protein
MECPNDVWSFIRLNIPVASGGAAVSYDGRGGAFWTGFFITVWTVGIDGKIIIGQFWITPLLNSYGLYQNLPNGFSNNRFMLLDATLQAVVMLLIATVMGFIGILVYRITITPMPNSGQPKSSR